MKGAGRTGAEKVTVQNIEVVKTIPEKNIILALSGGEDYELLFTSPLTLKKKISQISTQFHIPISCIGNTTKAKGELKIMNHEHKQIDILVKGFDHFNLNWLLWKTDDFIVCNLNLLA